MKLINVTDIDEFFRVIDQCEGKVELIGEDIRLNLKSKLAQYFSLAKLFNGENGIIPELEVVAYNQNDAMKIIDYMMRGISHETDNNGN